MTLVGFVFAALYLGSLFFRPALLPWVLALSICFPQTAMLYYSEGSGVSPFFVGIGILIARALYLWLLGDRRSQADVSERGLTVLYCFVAYALLMTALGPMVFRGTPVFSPRGGIDDQVAAQTPLDYTISHVAQAGYLVLGVLAAWYLVRETKVSSRVFELAIWTGLLLALASLVLGNLWPSHLIDNMPNVHYDVYSGRLRGTFCEPSVFGVFLSASMAYLIAALPRTRNLRFWLHLLGVAIALVEYSLSWSGTALVASGIVAGVAAWRWLRSQTRNRTGTLSSWFLIAVPGSALVASYVLPLIFANTAGVVLQKLGSSSFSDRTFADRFALGLLVRSWGLGLGLGSNRPSSLATMLLSCVGIVGTALFVWVVVIALRGAFRSPTARPLAWSLLAILLAQATAKPDLAMPIMWFVLGLCLRTWETAAAEQPAEDGGGTRAAPPEDDRPTQIRRAMVLPPPRAPRPAVEPMRRADGRGLVRTHGGRP